MAENHNNVARPYAKAVFDIAQESKKLDEWSDGLALLSQIIGSSEMDEVLTNPGVEASKRLELITGIAGKALTKPLNSLLHTLAENERLTLVPTIHDLFEKFRQEISGDMSVEVSSAYVLKPTEKATLEKALSKKFSRNVVINSTKDSHLIGGVKIKADDFVIDGSIKGQLTELANQLGI